jgi:hypothetical protein
MPGTIYACILEHCSPKTRAALACVNRFFRDLERTVPLHTVFASEEFVALSSDDSFARWVARRQCKGAEHSADAVCLVTEPKTIYDFHQEVALASRRNPTMTHLVVQRRTSFCYNRDDFLSAEILIASGLQILDLDTPGWSPWLACVARLHSLISLSVGRRNHLWSRLTTFNAAPLCVAVKQLPALVRLRVRDTTVCGLESPSIAILEMCERMFLWTTMRYCPKLCEIRVHLCSGGCPPSMQCTRHRLARLLRKNGRAQKKVVVVGEKSCEDSLVDYSDLLRRSFIGDV